MSECGPRLPLDTSPTICETSGDCHCSYEAAQAGPLGGCRPAEVAQLPFVYPSVPAAMEPCTVTETAVLWHPSSASQLLLCAGGLFQRQRITLA